MKVRHSHLVALGIAAYPVQPAASFSIISRPSEHIICGRHTCNIRCKSSTCLASISDKKNQITLDTTSVVPSPVTEADEENNEAKILLDGSLDFDLNKLSNNDVDEEEAMILVRAWTFLMALKEKLYTIIRQTLSDLVTIIKRSTQKTEAWVRDDAVGQLVSSALALIAFYAAVAAFAVWNIHLLGGEWSAPTEVTVPTLQIPEQPSSSGVQFQKPQWKAPKITTSYSNDNNVRETE